MTKAGDGLDGLEQMHSVSMVFGSISWTVMKTRGS